MKKAQLACLAVLVSLDVWGQVGFTPSDLAVLQIGDGSTALSTASAPLFIDEFGTSANSFVQRFAVPTDGSGVVLAGQDAVAGTLRRSPDGTFLTFAGYVAASGVGSISNSTVPRAVGIMNHLGAVTVSASTSGGLAFSAGPVSSALSDNQNFWLSGSAAAPANGGVWYSAAGGAPTQVYNGGNVRQADVFNGNLCFSVAGSGAGVYRYSGLPTSAATPSILFSITTSGASPNDFSISPDGNTVYVADDGNFLTRGIEKWVNNAGTWSLAYRLAVGANAGARSLAVQWGSTPLIFVTTSEAVSNRVVEVVDQGSASLSTWVTLETAGNNTTFRGLDFAPIPEPAVFALAAVGAVVFGLRRRVR